MPQRMVVMGKWSSQIACPTSTSTRAVRNGTGRNDTTTMLTTQKKVHVFGYCCSGRLIFCVGYGKPTLIMNSQEVFYGQERHGSPALTPTTTWTCNEPYLYTMYMSLWWAGDYNPVMKISYWVLNSGRLCGRSLTPLDQSIGHPIWKLGNRIKYYIELTDIHWLKYACWQVVFRKVTKSICNSDTNFFVSHQWCHVNNWFYWWLW